MTDLKNPCTADPLVPLVPLLAVKTMFCGCFKHVRPSESFADSSVDSKVKPMCI